MAAKTEQIEKVDATSPAVQAHLGILQSVIQRMAANSTSCKTWCITLVSAILVVVADKGKPEFTLFAFIPTILFFVLDAYYLRLEKEYRNSYNGFIRKVHDGTLRASDLFSVAPKGNHLVESAKAVASFSVWPFYLTLAVMILLALRYIA